MDNWKYGQEGEPALEQVELEKKKKVYVPNALPLQKFILLRSVFLLSLD